VRELKQTSEIVDSISVNYLLRNWPASNEWSTKAVRETVFASPKYPRLLNPDSLRATIAQGVTNGQIAYVGKNGDTYEPMCYQTETGPGDIEFSDEMFIITRETAEKYLASRAAAVVEERVELHVELNGKGTHLLEEMSLYTGESGTVDLTTTQTALVPTQAALTEIVEERISHLAWSGEIPPLKWMNFYSKVLTRFITDGGVKLTLQMEISPEKGISRQKIDEARIALRELGLNEDLHLE
jgi:hypothetical protein